MRTKSFFTAMAVALAVSTSASAQDKTLNFYVGASALGSVKTNMSYEKGVKNKLSWTPSIGAQLGMEKRLGVVSTLTEFEFATHKYKKHNFSYMERFNPDEFDKLSTFSLSLYAGKTIGSGRFQVPLYVGAGFDYLKGYPMHNVTGHLAAKARVKYYVTTKLGIYAGATFKYGFGAKGVNRSMSSDDFKKNDPTYNIAYVPLMLEAGLTFTVGK